MEFAQISEGAVVKFDGADQRFGSPHGPGFALRLPRQHWSFAAACGGARGIFWIDRLDARSDRLAFDR
jgi:hypothetical protein